MTSIRNDNGAPDEFMLNLKRESALTLAVQYAAAVRNQSFSAAGVCRLAEIFLAWLEGDNKG